MALRQRTQSDYTHLGRSIIGNHFRTETKKSKGAPVLNKLTDFISRRIWSWLYYYLDSRFGRPHPYPDYTNAPDNGVYQLSPDPVVLALCADWATNTAESCAVASRMREHRPDYTLHLGDTYFVGEPKEIAANFLDPGSPWIRGPRGSFAVLGNHEMYAKGSAFFDKLLPTLGIADGPAAGAPVHAAGAPAFRGQHAGFFCLENTHWRILGLDTGYHSIGRPILELLPWFQPDCRFDDKLVRWLRDTVKPGQDDRGLVLLTHHQYITAFNEPEYTIPAAQLATLIGEDREVLWLWGHEHRFSLYSKFSMPGGLAAYGRCIGHGGMPVEIKTNRPRAGKKGSPHLVMVDARSRKKDNRNDDPLGYNGYAILTLDGPTLHIDYCDTQTHLFRETWVRDGSKALKGEIQVDPHCPLQPVKGKEWTDAVR